MLENITNGFNRLRSSPDGISSPSNVNLISHIYDDEFVSLINSLSSAIKDFFKNSRSCFSSLKGSSDSIVENILFSKSNITDILMQINTTVNSSSTSNSKYSQRGMNPSNQKESMILYAKDNLIKDKITSLLSKLELINEI